MASTLASMRVDQQLTLLIVLLRGLTSCLPVKVVVRVGYRRQHRSINLHVYVYTLS